MRPRPTEQDRALWGATLDGDYLEQQWLDLRAKVAEREGMDDLAMRDARLAGGLGMIVEAALARIRFLERS